jgi:hypothetical protein
MIAEVKTAHYKLSDGLSAQFEVRTGASALTGGDRNIWAAIVGDRIVASVSMNQAPGPDDQFEKFSKAVTEELKFYGSIQPGEICDGKWHPRSFLTKRL